MSIKQVFLTHMGELENFIRAGKKDQALAQCTELRNNFSITMSHLGPRSQPEVFLTHMGELENLIHVGEKDQALVKCTELRNDFSSIGPRSRPEAPTSTGREWML